MPPDAGTSLQTTVNNLLLAQERHTEALEALMSLVEALLKTVSAPGEGDTALMGALDRIETQLRQLNAKLPAAAGPRPSPGAVADRRPLPPL